MGYCDVRPYDTERHKSHMDSCIHSIVVVFISLVPLNNCMIAVIFITLFDQGKPVNWPVKIKI